MTNPDDIQHDLEALLAAADPSPAFVRGIHEAIAAEAAPWRRRLVRGAWVVGTTTFASAIVAGVFAVRPPTGRVQPASSAAAASATSAVPPSVSPADVVVASLHPASSRHQRTHTAGGAKTVSTEVLVPDDERLALIHLLQGLKEDRASVPTTLGPTFDADGKLLPPEPVVIVPLPELAPPESDSSIRTVKTGTSGGAHR